VGRLVVPFEAIALAAVYLVVLVVSRELTGSDAQLLRALAGRKRTA
jgi:hypothetical protein